MANDNGVNVESMLRLSERSGGGGASSNPDVQLANAFQTLGKNIQGTFLAKSMYDANKQLDDIRTNIVDEDEKRQAQQQLASKLAFQMKTLGEDASSVQGMYHRIAPAPQPIVQNAEQAHIYGTKAQIEKADAYEQKKQDFDLAKIREKQNFDTTDPDKVLDRKIKNQHFWITEGDKIDKLMDPMAASSRTAQGKLADSANRLARLQGTVFQKPPADVTQVEAYDANASVAAFFNGGGQPTDPAMAHMMQPTVGSLGGTTEGFIKSSSAKLNSEDQIKTLEGIVGHAKQVVSAQVAVGNTEYFRGLSSGAYRDARDMFDDKVNKIMLPDGSRQSVVGEDKKGKPIFASDISTNRIKDTVQAIISDPNNPRAAQKFEDIKNDPFYKMVLVQEPNFVDKMKQAGILSGAYGRAKQR